MEDGEWLQYTVNNVQAGIYTLQLDVAANNRDGKLSIFVNDSPAAKNITIPSTGGEKKWGSVAIKNIRLNTGMNRLKVYVEKGGFTFKVIKFVK